MKVIRVTKDATNRIDAIFVGQNMLFVNPDFGLVALADRYDTESNEWDKKTIHHWKIERSEQISKAVIEKTITDYYSQYKAYLPTSHVFNYIFEESKPQHTLPYIVNIKLERR